MIKKENIGKRDVQQDSHFGAEKNGVSFAMVADGLGGMQGGEIASGCIRDLARKMFASTSLSHKNAEKFLLELKDRSQEAIREKSIELGIDARSTITAVLTIETKAYILHSGDSRIYHFNKNKFKYRTKDHSLVQILVDRGKAKEEDMGTHPDQGKLYNCLGGESGHDADFDVVDIQKDDWFLLCTDGFWEHLSRIELASLYPENESHASDLLLEAVKNGGQECDNVTFIALYPKFPLYMQLKSWFNVNNQKILISVLLTLILVLSLILMGKIINNYIDNTQEDEVVVLTSSSTPSPTALPEMQSEPKEQSQEASINSNKEELKPILKPKQSNIEKKSDSQFVPSEKSKKPEYQKPKLKGSIKQEIKEVQQTEIKKPENTPAMIINEDGKFEAINDKMEDEPSQIVDAKKDKE
ncbi:MAG: PP2C family serine/threonine-protein phosphatase [Opitutales bacterium]